MSSVGTIYKYNVNVEPIDGLTMDEYDFTVQWYVYENRSIITKKSELIRKDSENYHALVDSSKTGAGQLKFKLTAQIPDSDCLSGFRTEVVRGLANEVIER